MLVSMTMTSGVGPAGQQPPAWAPLLIGAMLLIAVGALTRVAVPEPSGLLGADERPVPLQATRTPDPSRTPTPAGSGEPALGLVWRRAAEGDVRYVEVDGGARAWLRLADPGGGPDAVARLSARRPVERWASLETLTEARYEELLRLGRLRDFFDVDEEARRVWIGARHYVDGVWTTVSRDPTGVGGGLRHAERVMLDGEGRATVPWQANVDCPTPGGCVEHGIDRFTADGLLEEELRFEAVPGAEREELPASYLLGDGVGEGWVAARREIVPHADWSAWMTYPPLVDDNGAPNAGYVTAATRSPDGAPLVLLWVERRDRPTLAHELSALSWTGEAWSEVLAPVQLAKAPFLSGDPAFDRIVAVAYDLSGRLWLAGQGGGLGLWSVSEGVWRASWSPEQLGLPTDARIRDVAVGGDGAVWLATSAGAWVGARPVAATLFIPRAGVP